MRCLAAVGALVLVGCGGQPFSLRLLLPATWSDGGALASDAGFTVSVRWPGGDAGATGVVPGSGFSISVPPGIPVDVWVTGSTVDGSPWRGELHGLVVDSSGRADAGILMLPVGQVGSFEARSLPALAGTAVAPLDLGKALLVGGDGAGGAWIWDQSAMAFSPAQSTVRAWEGHSVAPLNDGGEFIIAGGTRVETYSPFGDAGSTPIGALPDSLTRPGIAVFDGAIYVGCGALDGGGKVVCVDGGTVAADCAGGALVTLPDGVYAIRASKVVPVAGVVETFASPGIPRTNFAAQPDGDGGLLVTGGLVPGALHPVATSAFDDLGVGGSTAHPLLLSERANHILIDVGSELLAIGGIDKLGNERADLEVVSKGGDPERLVSLGAGHNRPAATLIPGYRIVLIVSEEAAAADGGAATGLDLYAVP